MRRVWFLLTVLASIATFGGSALAQNPPPPLEHFWCYFTPNQPVLSIPIMLQDQFDAALPAPQNWEKINQLTLARICNPVYKTDSTGTYPPNDPTHHLTMYQINPQPIIPRVVQTYDPQFQYQTLDVSDARFLLVPTGKAILPNTAPSPTPNLDHYKCYQACGPRVDRPVSLADQFSTENVTALWPVLFCNPVVKIHNNLTTPIQNNRDHLTCYSTTPSVFPGLPDPANPNSPAGINIWNQFERGNKTVQKPDLLCVPVQKTQWSAVPQATSAATPSAASNTKSAAPKK